MIEVNVPNKAKWGPLGPVTSDPWLEAQEMSRIVASDEWRVAREG